MRRTIVLKNTATGQAITLPVTPKSYPMEAGRLVERLDMAVTGQIALPGLLGLFAGTLEFWLPARSYPFLNSGAIVQPSYYIGLLSAWARSGAVCRYIVTGAGVNAAVLLGMLEYGENDGTNDVQCKLPLYEYRCLESAQVVQATQNAKRPAGTQPQKPKQAAQKKGKPLPLDWKTAALGWSHAAREELGLKPVGVTGKTLFEQMQNMAGSITGKG